MRFEKGDSSSKVRLIVPWGGGGVLLYFHAYVGSGYFARVQNFEFQYLGGGGGGVSEYFLNIFGGMKILWIFYGVITKLDYTRHFRVFSKSQGTKWRIYFGLLKFQIFIWGA